MGIGVSVFLIAVGAILAFAVNFHANGIDINTVGVILMIVGFIGLFASFLFWNSMGFGSSYRRTVVHDVDDPVVDRRVRTRRVVREDEIV
ncbi:MAG TPA: DUF6458 family protein [Acidimicrobiales bacterium]|nr:DUF6458 family protein [Acidimicrobiales bacterium]